ncbi:MAG: MurR/RpiR family transcriptional regulator [bacterium]
MRTKTKIALEKKSTPPNCIARIKSLYPSLTLAEQKVADYILKHPGTIYLSISQLADNCGVGDATVVRFCQKAGYSGYQELRLELAKESVAPTENIFESVTLEDDLKTLVDKISSINSLAIAETSKILDLKELERAIEAIAKARMVVFYGVGASGFTALDAKYKFLRIGILCDAYIDSHLQAMSAATLTPQDVVVGFSYSGSTKDVIDSLAVAKERGAKIICVTNFLKSPITKYADIKLITASHESPLRSEVLSKVPQQHLLDILFTGVSIRLYDQTLSYLTQTAKAVADKLL